MIWNEEQQAWQFDFAWGTAFVQHADGRKGTAPSRATCLDLLADAALSEERRAKLAAQGALREALERINGSCVEGLLTSHYAFDWRPRRKRHRPTDNLPPVLPGAFERFDGDDVEARVEISDKDLIEGPLAFAERTRNRMLDEAARNAGIIGEFKVHQDVRTNTHWLVGKRPAPESAYAHARKSEDMVKRALENAEAKVPTFPCAGCISPKTCNVSGQCRSDLNGRMSGRR